MDVPEDIQELRCSVSNISQRIYPIHYINSTLVIDSDVSAQNISADSATIQNLSITSISVSGDVVPSANTTYDLGSPTNWFANVYANEVYTSGGSVYVSGARLTANGDVLQLPTKTTIDGYPVLNTEYFYFFSNRTNFPNNRYILVGGATGPNSSSYDTNSFPFVAPTNCVLTSLMFSFAVGSGTSTVTNATAFIDINDTAGNVYYGVESAIIPSCPVNTKNFAESNFERSINKGDSAGIFISYSGSFGSTSRTPFAVIGYKRVPPTPVYTSPFLSVPLSRQLLTGHYYRLLSSSTSPYEEEEDPIVSDTMLEEDTPRFTATYGMPNDVEERRRQVSATVEN